VPGDPRKHETWMVWMSREDLGHLMRFPAEELYDKLVEQERGKLEEVPRPTDKRQPAYA
jgi:hypothetical protein